MRLRVPATVLTMAVLALPASAAASTPVTQHLTDGVQLVDNLELTPWPTQATINTYDADETNTHVTWGTVGVASGWSNDTKCARLVDELLAHSYGWATSTWFTQQLGSTTPDTAKWVAAHKAPLNPTHLETVNAVTAVAPGDIMLIDRAAGTGADHTAVVREVTPLSGGLTQQAGTAQYAVRVVDSTSNPHGYNINGTNHANGVNHDYMAWADTRRLDGAGISVTEYNGAGSGWMVVYASTADDTVYGWRWGVNESELNKISDGHKVMFVRVTAEA